VTCGSVIMNVMGVPHLVRGHKQTGGLPRGSAPGYTYYRLPRCVVFWLRVRCVCGVWGGFVEGAVARLAGREDNERFFVHPTGCPVGVPAFVLCRGSRLFTVFVALAGSCHSRFRTLTFVGSMRWGMRVLPTFPCVRPALCNEGTPTECSMGVV